MLIYEDEYYILLLTCYDIGSVARSDEIDMNKRSICFGNIIRYVVLIESCSFSTARRNSSGKILLLHRPYIITADDF